MTLSEREYLEAQHVNTTPAPMTLKEARRAYYAKTTTARCSRFAIPARQSGNYIAA